MAFFNEILLWCEAISIVVYFCSIVRIVWASALLCSLAKHYFLLHDGMHQIVDIQVLA